jgi:hypothetical protein
VHARVRARTVLQGNETFYAPHKLSDFNVRDIKYEVETFDGHL